MSNLLAQLFVEVKSDPKAVLSSFQVIKGAAAGLGSSITAALGPVGAAIAGAFAVSEMVKGFMEGELAVAELTSALESNGQEVENNMSRFGELAKEIQAATRIGDEQTFAILTKGLNLGIPAAELDNYAKSAIGLGTALKMGPEEAMAALAKEGQGVKSTLDKQIPALKGVTDQSERLAIISEFAAKGLVQEGAATQTLSGQMTQLWNGIGDLAETMGGFLAPVIGFGVALLKDLTAILQGVADAFADCSVDTQSLGEFMRAHLLSNIRMLAEVLKAVAPVVINVFGTLVGWFNQAADATLDLWNKVSNFGMRLPEVFNQILESVSSVLASVGEWFGFAGTSIDDFATNAIDTVAGFVETVTFTLMNLDLVFQEVGIFLQDFAAGCKDRFNYAMEVIAAFGTWFGSNFLSIFTTTFTNSLAIASNWATNLQSILKEAWDYIKSGGTDAFEPTLKAWDEGTKKVLKPLKMPEMVDSFDASKAREGLDKAWDERRKEWDAITREDPLVPTIKTEELAVIKAAEDKEKEKKAKGAKSEVGQFSGLGEAFKRANSAALKAQEKVEADQLKEQKKMNLALDKIAANTEDLNLGLE